MTSSEFVEWLAHNETDPPEPIRQDYRAALVAHTVARAMGGKSAQRLRLADFVLRFDRSDAPQLTTEQRTTRSKAYWSAVIAAGQIKRRGNGQPRHTLSLPDRQVTGA
jgi:hypothetical protein